MKWLQPNIDSFGEVLFRAFLTVHLAGTILWLGLDYLVFIPFMVVVTALSGFCPVKHALKKMRRKEWSNKRNNENIAP